MRHAHTHPTLRELALASIAAGALALTMTACAPVTIQQAPSGPPAAPVSYQPPPPVQAPPPTNYYVPPPPAPPPAPLDQLLAPIALYPDPLIAIVLPASTFPADVAAASSYLNGGGDPNSVDGQPWEQSVRALAHYPSVIHWMAQNLPWTETVGGNFVAHPAEVMEAIQRLRELARAAGTLTSSPQQQIVVEGTYVEIIPAQPNLIFVPRYDPAVVFVDNPYHDYHGPYFAFGTGFVAGGWLTFGANWGGRGVVVVPATYWHDDGGRAWRHDPTVNININVNVNGGGPRPWQFPPNRPRPQPPSNWQANVRVTAVVPIAGAPPRPPPSAAVNIHTHGAAAVAVVAQDPAAFKGRPINRAILQRTTVAPPASHGTAPNAGAVRATTPGGRPPVSNPGSRAEPTGNGVPNHDQTPAERAMTPVHPTPTRTPTAHPTPASARSLYGEPTHLPTANRPTPTANRNEFGAPTRVPTAPHPTPTPNRGEYAQPTRKPDIARPVPTPTAHPTAREVTREPTTRPVLEHPVQSTARPIEPTVTPKPNLVREPSPRTEDGRRPYITEPTKAPTKVPTKKPTPKPSPRPEDQQPDQNPHN